MQKIGAMGRSRTAIAAGLMWAATKASAQVGNGSALAGAGSEAQRVETLFWVMLAVGLLVWIGVVALALVASAKGRMAKRHVKTLVMAGGIVLPLITLAPLLIHGLTMLASLRPVEADLRIHIVGERWWWRVAYESDSGTPITLANELRLPVGKTIALSMTTPEILHSLWIPALGGKLDLIPGRTTVLHLQPIKTGLYRGVCAEYCGTAHSQMAFMVEVMQPAPFAAWLQAQAEPARAPTTTLTISGQQHYQRTGCQGCHSIRGTSGNGVIGPDLTHVGSRYSLAAAALPNGAAALQRWLSRTHVSKPGTLMPDFGHLPADEIEAIAAYLDSLK